MDIAYSDKWTHTEFLTYMESWDGAEVYHQEYMDGFYWPIAGHA